MGEGGVAHTLQHRCRYASDPHGTGQGGWRGWWPPSHLVDGGVSIL